MPPQALRAKLDAIKTAFYCQEIFNPDLPAFAGGEFLRIIADK
jgi:hypothetical protein